MRVFGMRLHRKLLLVNHDTKVCVLDKCTPFVNPGYKEVDFDP
jgi:hypothetical protein